MIKHNKAFFPKQDNSCSESDICVYQTAIEALKKQIPKKPKEMKYELLIEYGWKYACPTCGCACGENMYHYDVTKDDMFCTQCGQLLDWSE